ncbi:crotonobetainyl-CoA:carnitine CoA-transferase CaiB-like acyl-CoA transferase [Saccharopolyspora erythraea NRRL 2338]|uniref:Predicted acyl-CoA transferase/carnitine dehydratase n=2 Tax=Saccharopolyspora erythraea TaxID=1836 RepID=A4FH71_SACEN|nr:CoA transferase [Saccharopolyspora erythraea]EQD81607.1 acyl-CoA transferase [Saccharopolyspora erythraea D]PFG97096.1 crotonobetainyl-CoA:carnitine CoA-transferase CaiB-like acyl-CoA transferase [Saccharopolyspora erythraea NRRL 2338]QRK87305.1 CoA transferase [Saccharopolyspora erythraea]CAM03396.1 predicted acyl-CoA transferase/carnitine dehydratase [Saccharopolyspora erythraea NRRL 2338]
MTAGPFLNAVQELAPFDHGPLSGMQYARGDDSPTGFGVTQRLIDAHLGLLGAGRAAAAQCDPGVTTLSGPDGSVELRLRGACGTDPDRVFRESTAQARCGLMSVHSRAEPAVRRIGVDYASVLAGVTAVQGVLAATLARLRGAPVGAVELALEHAAVMSVAQYIGAASASEDAEKLLPGAQDGRPRPPFASSDGVLFELEALDVEPWQRFWAEIGAPIEAVSRSWRPFVLRYPGAVSPLAPGLAEALGEHDFAGITEIAERAGMSVCRVRTVAERRADPDLWPSRGSGAPWEFAPAAVPAEPAAHSDRLSAGELPLAGMRIVESSRRVQGPMATRLLSLLGAEIIRIEPPGGDPLRGIPPMAGDVSARFVALNHAKRIVEIDIKDPAGQRSVLELVRDADVFLHNWAPGKAAQFGLDAEHMHEVNPRLVYAYASGWGSALGERPPLGTDFMVQAHAGVADAVTPDGEDRHPSLMTLLDVLGGFVAAEGVLAGLVSVRRNGSGCRVDTSLLSAATTLLAERLAGANPESTALDEVFRTADGLLAVCADEEEVERLTAATGLAPAPGTRPADLTERLRTALAARPAHEWERVLGRHAVPAAQVEIDLADLPRREDFADVFQHHGCAVVASPWRFQ